MNALFCKTSLKTFAFQPDSWCMAFNGFQMNKPVKLWCVSSAPSTSSFHLGYSRTGQDRLSKSWPSLWQNYKILSWPDFELVLLPHCPRTISHLFCTLISENTGLEKLRSTLNLRKISGPAKLDFFSVHLRFFFSLSAGFFSDLYHKPKKEFSCTEKKSNVQELKFW